MFVYIIIQHKKSTLFLVGYKFVDDNKDLQCIFIRLAAVASQICEIPKKFELQQFKIIQGHRPWR